jgi:DNA-binding NarL/FixJ family response regulator
MFGSGKTVKEIAEILSLSIRTISTHRAHILNKMEMKNNAQLTYYAIKNALVE